ncbi:hypothetical protein SLE2022_381160 [Rubroshorea leprosula]
MWDIKGSMQVAIQSGLNRLYIESDSSIAMYLITQRASPTHYLFTLILDCRDMLQLFEYVKLSHVVKEANMYAELTKIGCPLSKPFVIFEDCPPSVIHFHMVDTYGVLPLDVNPFI